METQFLFSVLVPSAIAVVVVFVILFLKNRYGKDGIDPSEYSYEWEFWAQRSVMAAEQIFGDADGAIKFDWVIKFLKNRFPDASEDDLKVLIEFVVNRMKRSDAAQ